MRKMLCPEVWNFPSPKVMCYNKQNETLESVIKTINMNSFYKSLIITCPDEVQTPRSIEETVTEDTDYYKIWNCSLTEFIEPVFIENFVRNGGLYCLSANRNCVVQNCAALTPDGVLTLHILDFIYQTLGLEGSKRLHNYYEVKIDLKILKQQDKVQQALKKLEFFDFYIIWEPQNKEICPSSIAKYFNDKKIKVTVHILELKKLSPLVKEIPSVRDIETDELVEWIGMLAHEANLNQTETYISTYNQPDSENPIKSNRISLFIVKGYFSSTILMSISKKLAQYVMTRQLDNYWASLSVQSCDHCLWQWNTSSPKMFQAHDSSCNVFFTHKGQTVYSLGQIKYS